MLSTWVKLVNLGGCRYPISKTLKAKKNSCWPNRFYRVHFQVQYDLLNCSHGREIGWFAARTSKSQRARDSWNLVVSSLWCFVPGRMEINFVFHRPENILRAFKAAINHFQWGVWACDDTILRLYGPSFSRCRLQMKLFELRRIGMLWHIYISHIEMWMMLFLIFAIAWAKKNTNCVPCSM